MPPRWTGIGASFRAEQSYPLPGAPQGGPCGSGRDAARGCGTRGSPRPRHASIGGFVLAGGGSSLSLEGLACRAPGPAPFSRASALPRSGCLRAPETRRGPATSPSACRTSKAPARCLPALSRRPASRSCSVAVSPKGPFDPPQPERDPMMGPGRRPCKGVARAPSVTAAVYARYCSTSIYCTHRSSRRTWRSAWRKGGKGCGKPVAGQRLPHAGVWTGPAPATGARVLWAPRPRRP